jgi:hypothetical protein
MAEGTSLALAGKGIVQHGLVVLVDFSADVAHHQPLCLIQDGSRVHHEDGFRPVFVNRQ